MIRPQRKSYILLISALNFLGLAISSAEPEQLSELRSQFSELREDLDEPKIKFQERYELELDKAAAAARTKADLSLALAIDKEKKLYRKGSPKTIQ